MNAPRSDQVAYQAAHATVAFADVRDHGWLRLTGRDRLELLHRLSTNDLCKLSPGAGRPTVLTSPTGRVMAFLLVYAGEDATYLRTQNHQTSGVMHYLRSMIFWQDQVEVADLGGETARFDLYGPGTEALLTRWTYLALAEIPAYGWCTADLAGVTIALHRGGPLAPHAWTIVAAHTSAAAVHEALTAQAPMLAAATTDLLRIEAGLPVWGRELSDQVTPLETGLLPAISFNKGCYTGQEIIARQTTYDKVTRNLAGLLLPEHVADVDLAGATVRGPGRGGFIGSTAFSPVLGRPIALAIIPRELTSPGTEVVVVKDNQEITALVTTLPFIGKP